MPRDIARRRTSPENNTENAEGKMAETRERVTKDGTASHGSGWSSNRRPVNLKTGGSVRRFTYDEGKETLIKILEDAPFVSFWQHWIDKKAYTCLIENCPLCNIGDQPKPVDCFNVIEFTESGPELKLWQCSANPSKAIQSRAEKPRTSPVNREDLYWAVTKTIPANKFAETSLDPVKAEDLKDDWGIEPLTAGQLDKFSEDAYTDEIVRTLPRHELVELANSLE
jgi:hypothetical protein